MRLARILITLAVVGLLVLLVAREVHRWSQFDWAVFWRNTRGIHLGYALLAFALINAGLALRALRWKLLLWPHRASAPRLLPATFIGFTGLALLGRAGEFVRPYLIARQEGLPVSSQFGVWTLERVLDLGSFAAIAAFVFVTGSGLQSLPHIDQFRRAGLILVLAVFALAVGTFILHRHGTAISGAVERLLSPFAPIPARKISAAIATFGHGVRALANVPAMLGAIACSLLIWIMIVFCYVSALHAFPAPLSQMSFGAAVILVGFSIAGGLVQLPGASTSQLIVIAALVDVFHIPSELAVSSGILLWICAYMAPVPFGLALLRRKHLSLRGLSRESRRGEAQTATP